MNSTIPEIIDNRRILLKDVVKELLKKTENAKIASGYFFLSGFNLVKEDFSNIKKFQLLMGRETDLETAKELTRGHKKKEINFKESVIVEMTQSIEELADDNQKKKISDLYDLINEGIVEVKIYTKERFHSKAYIFELNDSLVNVGIVGSSNFTASGLSHNTELNSTLFQPSALNELNKWFDELWEEADNFQEDLLRIIEGSHSINKYRSKKTDFVYLHPDEFIKTIIKILNKEYLLEKDNILLPFQELDFKLAKDIISNYGGVIIANSVGLGKSYIASKLLFDYYINGKSILLIIPPNLREQWIGYLGIFGITLADKDILSMYEISQEDFSEDHYKNYDVVLIDESHNFRNKDSNRWKNFMKRIKNNKAAYILLTATPINNSLKDLQSQIDLFMLENKFRNDDLFKLYNSLVNYIKKEDESLKKDIKQLREKLIVRTTRRDLKHLYKEISIPGKGKVELIEPQLAEKKGKYRFTGEIYEQIFDEIITFLDSLELPHLKILNPDAGKFLIGLYKILLYKRFESSIYAFYKSILHLESKEKNLEQLLKKYSFKEIRQLENKELMKSLRSPDEAQQILFQYLELGKQKKKDEKDIYLADIKNDLEKIDHLKGLIEKLKKDQMKFDDDKIEVLRGLIDEFKDKKILLFTQYVDTANYLFDNFKSLNTKDFTIRKVTGKTKDKITEIIRFSPTSQDHSITEKYNVKAPYTDFLISTDTLSEGVNLQEADYIINYDLPWNPVRLIQRVGRANRIGSNKKVTVVNFIPDKKIDKEMNLISILKGKIDNIIEIIGSEYSILTLDELEKIRKKEVQEMKLLIDKRGMIRKLEFDKLEEEEARSKLSDLDRFILQLISTQEITKDEIKGISLPKKIVYTTHQIETEGYLFLYSLDDGETSQIKFTYKSNDEYTEDYVPTISALNSTTEELSTSNMVNIKEFISSKLVDIEAKRKVQQHLVFDQRTDNVKKKIVRELQNFVYNQQLIAEDTEFKEKLKKSISYLEGINVPKVYYKEIHQFFLSWIKDKQYLKSREEFFVCFEQDLDVLKKSSDEKIQSQDIKTQIKGFIVYGE